MWWTTDKGRKKPRTPAENPELNWDCRGQPSTSKAGPTTILAHPPPLRSFIKTHRQSTTGCGSQDWSNKDHELWLLPVSLLLWVCSFCVSACACWHSWSLVFACGLCSGKEAVEQGWNWRYQQLLSLVPWIITPPSFTPLCCFFVP